MTQYKQFLETSLLEYKNTDVAKRDVLNVCTSFNDLRPSLDGYVFNDGTKKSLLHLDGTIPVSYKGAEFNIPICVWLMDTHPYDPPMVYVKPTASMHINPGRYVDSNGKVDLPYLRIWRYPNSDLLGLIQILTIVFSEESPLYSRASYQQQMPPYPAPKHDPPTGGTQAGYPSQGSFPGQFTGYPQRRHQHTGYPFSSYRPGLPAPSSYPSSTPSSYPTQSTDPQTSYLHTNTEDSDSDTELESLKRELAEVEATKRRLQRQKEKQILREKLERSKMEVKQIGQASESEIETAPCVIDSTTQDDANVSKPEQGSARCG